MTPFKVYNITNNAVVFIGESGETSLKMNKVE